MSLSLKNRIEIAQQRETIETMSKTDLEECYILLLRTHLEYVNGMVQMMMEQDRKLVVNIDGVSHDG